MKKTCNYIEPQDRKQSQLSFCLDELVSADHVVRIIDSIIDSIVINNMTRFEKGKNKNVGRKRYHDSTMLKLYLYGYFNGISSSRKLEVETHRNNELIWLLGGLRPDHWTISNYRKEKGEEIKFVTREFRRFLKNNDYIKLNTVAVDGSKVKAYTNREMLTKEKIEKKLESIDKKISDYLSRLSEIDERDAVLDDYEESDQIDYLDKIIKLRKEVEKLTEQKRILEEENRNYISGYDTEARMMKTIDGKQPCYNIQTAVDSANRMIADEDVVTDESDMNQIQARVESLEKECNQKPAILLADCGYNNPNQIESLEKENEGMKVYVSQPITKRDKEEIGFEYDKENDQYICSEGKRLILKQKGNKYKNTIMDVYQGLECAECRKKKQCTNSKKGRIYKRHPNQEWRNEYKKKMQSRKSQSKLSSRKSIVEHPFGTLKILMGKVPILLRGVEKVLIEIKLYCVGYNLKRLINIESFDELMNKIRRFDWKMA